jgi:hypothetical protein
MCCTRTGKLVFKNLLLNQEYQPIGTSAMSASTMKRRSYDGRAGLVRSSKSVNELKKLGASDEQIIVGDVLQPTALASAMTGKDYLVRKCIVKRKVLALTVVLVLMTAGYLHVCCPEGEEVSNLLLLSSCTAVAPLH